MRPEIQALRALAVALVVVYHLWPGQLRGGFIGVDVFFVISGYLITRQLVREALATGRVSLRAFWWRRIRRLLPAALVVLGAVTVATWTLVPRLHWQQYFGEIIASAAYAQNWLLASSAVDYFAAGNEPSPTQHFWSLSVEEQFYIAWPVVVVAALVLAGAEGGARRRRLAVGVALGVIAAGSLAASIALTAQSPAEAYLVTPTRAWEFAAGGLLAVVAARQRSSVATGVVGLLGWAGIVASAVVYTSATAFPGYAALLPVIATMAVIWAGPPVPGSVMARLVSLRPVQFLGGISYSLYLWHWPLVVLVPLVVGELTVGERIAVAATSVALAWATRAWVEDPVRSSDSRWSRRPAIALGGIAAAMALVMAVASTGLIAFDRESDASEAAIHQALDEGRACFGAAALADAPQCSGEPPVDFEQILPTPETAADDYRRCITGIRSSDATVFCSYPSNPETEVWALIGDSHADALAPAVVAVARAEEATVRVISKGQCPYIDGWRGDPASDGALVLDTDIARTCSAWNADVREYLHAHPEITRVVVTGSAHNEYQPQSVDDAFAADVAAYQSAWGSVPPSVDSIVVIRDVPRQKDSMPECVLENPDDFDSICSAPRQKGLLDDPISAAAEATDDQRVSLVDLTDLLCTPRVCPAVIGGVLAYTDHQHLTATFAKTLAPYLAERMR